MKPAFVLVCSALLAACANEAETRADPALLISSRAVAEDTITLLIARQRALFALLAGNDRGNLREYAEPGYSWRYMSSDSGMLSNRERKIICLDCPAAIRAYLRPAVSYLDLVTGFKPASLDTLPNEYSVNVKGRMAVVTATRRPNPIRIETFWQLTPAGWRASSTRQTYVMSELARLPQHR